MNTCAKRISAFDSLVTGRPNVKANIENDRIEFLWVELNEAADIQLEAGRFVVAAEKWQQAFRIAQQFDGNDPRLASSLNNVAISHRIRGDLAGAEQYYQHAMVSWQAAAAWVDEMHLAARARSSLFHLRMERKHQEQYDRIAVRKYKKLLPAGHAGTLNNLAELCQITNRLEEAAKFYEQALQERVSSMGGEEPGVAVIRNNIASLSNTDGHPADSVTPISQRPVDSRGFSLQATRRRWIVDHPAEFTDEGRLMAALLLAQVNDHLRLMHSGWTN